MAHVLPAKRPSLISRLKDRSAHNLANLEVTYRCNLRCRSCGLTKLGLDRKEDELTTAQWKKVVGDLHAIGKRRFSIIGAEPLVRRDLPEIVACISEKGALATVTSNGILLQNGTGRELVQAGLENLVLSLDGPPNIHDTVRKGDDLYGKIKEGVETLIAFREKNGFVNPRITLHTTVSRLNASHLAQLLPCVQDLHADGIRFQYISETPEALVRATRYNGLCIGSQRFIPREGSLLCSNGQMENMREQLKEIQRTARKSSVNVHIDLVKNLGEQALTKGFFPVKQCSIVRDRLIVDPYGNLYPCAHLDFFFGNLLTIPVSEIVTGTRYKTFLKQLQQQLFPVCTHCCNFAYNVTLAQRLQNKIGIPL